jgi:FlaA1/EpsC-like NDP-sugar epimerase
MNFIDIPLFISTHVTKREQSMFDIDIQQNHAELSLKIKDKAVLVIGGAGTIGSSYIKAILRFEPRKLVVVDTNENGLTELTRDLRSTPGQYIPSDYITYPMNFGEPVFKKMFLEQGPFEIVANFAAHKHVRSEKDHYSIEAMLDNNVFKAQEFLDFLCDHKPDHFFCVSTDKAANPVNVMGGSKKLMEEVIMAYSKDLHITTARFANVAFSNGSLLDGYIQRLFKRQAISCPADVKRFFVSPEESGQICMLACILGQSGEIFFPKLEDDEQVYFKAITEDFFLAAGRQIRVCSSEEEARNTTLELTDKSPYPVYFFNSDTSGEKLYEEFYTEQDELDLSRFDSLGVITNAKCLPKLELQHAIKELKDVLAQEQYDKEQIVAVMKRHISDFEHIETGKNLDQKM